MTEPVPRELIVEVTDAERSRHEFNGKICIDTEQLIENGKLEDIWAPLENCDSGEMLIAADVFSISPDNVILKPRHHDNLDPDSQLAAFKANEKDSSSSFCVGV